MRSIRILLTVVSITGIVFLGGCENKKKSLQLQNRALQERIDDLESRLNANALELQQCNSKLGAAEELCSADTESLRKTIAALEQDAKDKEALIAKMQSELLNAPAALPVELSNKLEDWAKNSDMVTYEPSSGMVKFKADLLFELGSDRVAVTALDSLKKLAEIMNSPEAQEFDMIIAGHTDDIPILKPDTLAIHPSNWHLSAHRSISVVRELEKYQIDPTRMSVRGFSEYRPIAANAPQKKGNEKNRRVEIYIVPKGK